MQMQSSMSLFFSKQKNEVHKRKTFFCIFKKQRHAMHLRLNPSLHAYKTITCSFLLFLYKRERETTYKLMHVDNKTKVNVILLYTPQKNPRFP